MRKRYARIIRDAILDVRWDWDATSDWFRTPSLVAKSSRDLHLYVKAYNRELDNISRRELAQTHKKIRESLSKL